MSWPDSNPLRGQHHRAVMGNIRSHRHQLGEANSQHRLWPDICLMG